MLTKCLLEASGDQTDFARPYQNFSAVVLNGLVVNKTTLKINTALLVLHLMTNIRFFTAEQNGGTIKDLNPVPALRSTQFFLEQDTINTILQLLLYKDKQIAGAVLNLLAANFSQDALLTKTAEYNTFWERILYAGLRSGLALPALEAICSLLKKAIKDPHKYEKQLKALDRMFPKFIISWLSNHTAQESLFLLEFEERVDAEIYWTQAMFEKLKNTIGQIFPLDLQNIEEFTSGRKKVLPKVRNPPITVQIYYELPKELLAVDGLFLNSLVDEKNTYSFSDRKLIPETLLNSCLSILQLKLASKEFTNYENITCSHTRILARTCLKLVRANLVKEKTDVDSILNLFSQVSDHWVKHSTRITVRGPQINYYFTQTLIDLFKTVSIVFSLDKEKSGLEHQIFEVVQKVLQ